MPTPKTACHVEALRVAVAELIDLIDTTPTALADQGRITLSVISALHPLAVAQIEREPHRWACS